MNCCYCHHPHVVKFGTQSLQDGTQVQKYRCKGCQRTFNERTGTSMARLRTPQQTVTIALKMRSEGMGVRASGRVLNKSHSAIIQWENRIAAQQEQWSPPAPTSRTSVTLKGDELSTRVGENLPPH
jgi:transposase-like protein